MHQNLRIVLINHKDQNDINAFSGTSHFMRNALKDEFEEVIEFDMPESEELIMRVSEESVEKVLAPIGQELSNILKYNNIDADFVICQGGNTSVPFYNYTIPIVFWHDSTWHTFLRGYMNAQSFDEFKIKYPYFYWWDKKALEIASIAIFTSTFIAEACIRNYGISRNKVKVIPFGANLHLPPSQETLKEALNKRRRNSVLNLTFLGKDWKRKGLPAAIELTESLNSMGLCTILHIIGCYPDLEDIALSPNIKLHGYINKAENRQIELFDSILQETHFLIHPAFAEPYGIATCEANAYGIPVIGTAIEGLKTTVINGRNGFLFDREEFGYKAIHLIKYIMSDFERYVSLFFSSLQEFNLRLNWKSSVRELKKNLSAYHQPRTIL